MAPEHRPSIERGIDHYFTSRKSLDEAAQAAELMRAHGVPSTLVTEAVYARCLSAMKQARVRASKVLKGPMGKKYDGDKKAFIEQIRQALYASKICSYAQGYVQMPTSGRTSVG